MNLQKLAKNLQRDFKANPKKGLILVLLSVAGLYFWGPILKRWTFAAASKDALPVIVQDDPRPPKKAVTKAKALPWNKIDGALANNQHSQPLQPNHAALLRNPFVAAALESADIAIPGAEEELEEEAPVEIPVEEDFAPSEVGIIVKSVSIGPKGSLAFINGRVYKVGDSIPLPVDPKDEGSPPLDPFKVLQVESWGAVYGRKDKFYSQKLNVPQLHQHDQIVWGETADEDSEPSAD